LPSTSTASSTIVYLIHTRNTLHLSIPYVLHATADSKPQKQDNPHRTDHERPQTNHHSLNLHSRLVGLFLLAPFAPSQYNRLEHFHQLFRQTRSNPCTCTRGTFCGTSCSTIRGTTHRTTFSTAKWRAVACNCRQSE
jgi:hypothetical protein